MKKKLFSFLLTALSVVTLSAQEQIIVNLNDVRGIENISEELRTKLEKVPIDRLVNLLKVMNPALKNADPEVLAGLVEYYKGNATTLAANTAYIPDNEAFKTIISQIIGQVYPYVDKVLPLYLYIMNNRVIPDMDTYTQYQIDTIAAAPVDEIFYGIGDERNNYSPMGLSETEIAEGLAQGGQVKHNQSYLWGMVTVGSKVYWCTNTNYLCVGGTAGLGSNSKPGEDVSKGYKNKCWVCEFESGTYGKQVHGAVSPEYVQYSDTRLPRIYCYDTNTGMAEDITPSGGDYDRMLQDCQGLRSAGYHKGVVFFGGPSLYGADTQTTVGSSFFAYDADAGKFIGCNDMSDIDGNKITDIRRWCVHNDILYCGVRVTDRNGRDRGAVLRWYGDKENPWQFKVVGWTANEAAELCIFNGRMYVGGWGTASEKKNCLIKGPVVPAGGLQPVDIDEPEWDVIWTYNSYDKNSVSPNFTYTAGLQAWNGKLYWGMFCASYVIPGLVAKMGYTDMTSPEAIAYVLGQLRQTSFWRVDSEDNIELLYGEKELPVWNRPLTGEDTWTLVETGYTPVFGRAGFGQVFTAYAWTMAEYHDDLYVGTMNMENLLDAVTDDESGNKMFKIVKLLTGVKEENYGFELLRWTSPDKAPLYVTKNGFGNGTAYGIRNFTLSGDDLYIGSASPFNLQKYGGWHLFKLHSDGIGTSVEAATTKELGIYYRRYNGAVIFSSANGENVKTVEVFDLGGSSLQTSEGNGNICTIDTTPYSGRTVIVKVTTARGNWSAKMAF